MFGQLLRYLRTYSHTTVSARSETTPCCSVGLWPDQGGLCTPTGHWLCRSHLAADSSDRTVPDLRPYEAPTNASGAYHGVTLHAGRHRNETWKLACKRRQAARWSSVTIAREADQSTAMHTVYLTTEHIRVASGYGK